MPVCKDAGQGGETGQEVTGGALDGAWVGRGPQCGEMGLDSGYILGGGPGRVADGLAVGTKRKRLQDLGTEQQERQRLTVGVAGGGAGWDERRRQGAPTTGLGIQKSKP